ncbi:sensor histidine kinase [Flavobacterium haoranii]|uniref:histidine kinase n=1 Tax=Flavobacterium haoranii TaxID=683124 RepID=A0A1M6EV67_9FLAO|nr:HAMP domain-containing sensor histidine kinase [Flavobacterium haoranii]SHI89323.1 two-component system, OmpR family, phosphate regulon sensor histidine kinase PhoR [Flavobacterium haoranii]
MKLKRINVLVVIGLLAIVGVIIMQLFLLNQAYSFEKKDVEDKIHFALQDVVEKIYADNHSTLPITNQIKKVSDNYYIVNVDDVFENNILEHYLKTEFEKVKLEQDFEYAIYNCGTDDMIYGNYIAADGKPEKKCEDCFTKNEELIYYFAIRFPNLKQSYFSSLKQYWAFTVVLFFVLIIYVYSVFLLLKQKRYTELQHDFINNMTHEFKTPLSSILIASNYANTQKEISENKKLSKYIQIIIDQSNKLNQHIEQILSVAKTDSHQIQLKKSPVEVVKTIDLIIENCKLKHNTEFDVHNSIQENVTITADSFHFYNLLFNLFENAIKYGNNNIVIKVSLIENVKYFSLIITDNGPGIPEKDLPFIFDKFYRVSRKDNEEIEGFGIGLAYVKKICELHHWKIKVKNGTIGLETEIKIPKKDLHYV